MPRNTKPSASVSSGRVKKTKMTSPIVNEAIKDKIEGVSEEEKALLSCERRKHAFAQNTLKIENLISDECMLRDISLALEEPSYKPPVLPTVDYIKAMDGGTLKFIDKDFLDVVDRRKVVEIYEKAIATTLRRVEEAVSDKKLVDQIVACHKLIFILLQTTEERVSAVESIDAAEMAARVSFYFDSCDATRRSYTVPGLAYAIGFMSRKHLLQFVAEHEDTISGYIIARSLMRIEDQRNIEIISGGGMMAGHKLDLATNFDWNDAKAKASKEDNVTNITNNTVNMNSLPPNQMSIEDWQKMFLAKQAPAIDVTPDSEAG